MDIIKLAAIKIVDDLDTLDLMNTTIIKLSPVYRMMQISTVIDNLKQLCEPYKQMDKET